VELALEVIVTAESVPALLRICKHSARLSGQRPDGGVWGNLPAVRSLARNIPHRTPGYRWHGLQQVAGLRIAMEGLRDLADALGQPRSRSGHRPSDLGQRLLRQGSDRLGHNRQQFAGGHADERQEVLGGFIFGFSLSRQ
jgi:hypothetical protein